MPPCRGTSHTLYDEDGRDGRDPMETTDMLFALLILILIAIIAPDVAVALIKFGLFLGACTFVLFLLLLITAA